MLPIQKSNRRNLQKKKAKFFTLKKNLREKASQPISELNVNNFKFYRKITPCLCYNVDGGLPLTDYLLNASSSSQPKSIMNAFNQFVNFTHVSHDRDLDCFSIFLEYTTINRFPIDLLIDRLTTLNDLEAYSLSENLKLQKDLANQAKSLTPFPNEASSLLFDPYQTPPPSDNDYREFKEKIASLCMKYKDKPYISIRSRRNNISNLMIITEFGVSTELASLLGYEKESFVQRILKRGFPRMYHDKQCLRDLNELLDGLNRKNLGEKIDIKYELISEKYGIIKANGKLEIFYFAKNNYLDFFTLQFFDLEERDKKIIEAMKKEEIKRSIKPLENESDANQKTVIVEDLPFRKESIKMLKNHYPTFRISRQKKTDIYRCNYKEI